jgi:hypothetical protein
MRTIEFKFTSVKIISQLKIKQLCHSSLICFIKLQMIQRETTYFLSLTQRY